MRRKNQDNNQKIIEKRKNQTNQVENLLKELNIKTIEIPNDLSTINEDISILIRDSSNKKK